jgi:misacylated tRNA(Ala) deacylase
MKKQYDPHMHTAEHILNQTMVRLLCTGRCFSAHIERKKSKCDYHFDRPLTPGEENLIVEKVNEVIKTNLPVTEKFTSLTEAEKKFDLSRLPEGNDNQIRIIHIGNYDQCPCIGPHVKSTAEIGRFRITSSSFENGVLRIRFKLKRSA